MRATARPPSISSVSDLHETAARVALTASAAGTAAPEIPAVPVVPERLGRLGRLLAIDERLLVAAARFQGPWRTRLARGLTRVGDASSWTLVVLAFLALGGPLVRPGVRMGVAALLATALSQLLKRRLNRPRPTRAIEGFEALADNPDAFSFPSGHTSAAFAVAVALAGAPFGLGPAALLLAIGIGMSRVYLGAHYPLDVAAGTALGTIAGAAARFVVAALGG